MRKILILLLLPFFTKAQIITTIAGGGSSLGDGGPATNANIGITGSIATDDTGNLYIVGVDRIRKVKASSGIITTIAGTGTAGFSGDGGAATAAQFNFMG